MTAAAPTAEDGYGAELTDPAAELAAQHRSAGVAHFDARVALILG